MFVMSGHVSQGMSHRACLAGHVSQVMSLRACLSGHVSQVMSGHVVVFLRPSCCGPPRPLPLTSCGLPRPSFFVFLCSQHTLRTSPLFHPRPSPNLRTTPVGGGDGREPKPHAQRAMGDGSGPWRRRKGVRDTWEAEGSQSPPQWMEGGGREPEPHARGLSGAHWVEGTE